MKKIISLLFISAFAISFSFAQSSVGIRGGISAFNFGGQDVSENDYTNRAGFHLGLYADLMSEGLLSIEPGVYYSVKGTQNDDAFDSRAILNYVDIPVLFRLRFGEGFNVFAGPQLSLLTKSTFEGDLGGSTISFESDNVKSTDTGLVFGLGYNLPKGLNIQGSYDYGLTPIFKNSDADIYNRGFKVSLGLSF